MKPTAINMHGLSVVRAQIKALPNWLPASTTTGKVHHAYGTLCRFTNREACEETLRLLGFVPDRQCGSFTDWKRAEVAS